MQRFTLFFILLAILYGCGKQPVQKEKKETKNHFARGFEIEKNGEITKLTVFNPWEKANNISYEYFLVNENYLVPDSIKTKNVIKTPVKRLICLSTSHLGFIEALDETKTIVGISGSLYVSNSEIQKRIEDGKVVDVGYGQNLNYELILNQHPDLVMVYGVGSEVTEYSKKLEELGIPVIMNAEYLEESPLGKAEWMKFMGVFFEKGSEADAFYTQVETNYLSLKKRVENITEKPKVLVGSPYKDSWWVPGGNSYLAKLIEDAGGEYLGKSNSSHESYVVSFENAFTWGNEADVWINMSNMASKNEILSTDERFKSFRVFNHGRIFNNIKRLSPAGGNDFWESGTVHPDLILRDLISVFYPEIIDEEMVYYQEIK